MKKIIFFTVLIMVFVFQASAHCDTKQGPVAKAAEEALKTGNVNIVLVWVPRADEKTIREAFEKTIKIRKDPDAREMADNYFLETVVRIHRAGEGMAYTGVKDTSELDPGIAAADLALESGSLNKAKSLLTESLNKGLEERFHAMMERKNYKTDDVEAGRKFVESYVSFMHYVEGIYAATQSEGHHQGVPGTATHSEAHNPGTSVDEDSH